MGIIPNEKGPSLSPISLKAGQTGSVGSIWCEASSSRLVEQ
jgi:hypothetical protein